jgi:hypothetical protein
MIYHMASGWMIAAAGEVSADELLHNEHNPYLFLIEQNSSHKQHA